MNKFKPPINFNKDEIKIWNVLINNDFNAFCNSDWSILENDFISEGFFGIQANKSSNKLDWELQYDTLESYKLDWINQSREFNKFEFLEDPLSTLFNTTKLSKIEIKDSTAMVNKEFNGRFLIKNNKTIELNWISIFLMRKINDQWKIASFVGYMPK